MWRDTFAPLFKPCPAEAPIMLPIFSRLDEDKLIDPLRGWKMSQNGAKRKNSNQRPVRDLCSVRHPAAGHRTHSGLLHVLLCRGANIESQKFERYLLWLENQNVLDSTEEYFSPCVCLAPATYREREAEPHRFPHTAEESKVVRSVLLLSHEATW